MSASLTLRPLQIGDEAAFDAAAASFLTPEPSDSNPEKPPFGFAFRREESADFSSYVRRVEAWSRGEELPEGWAPNTFLVAEVAGEIVGRVSIRHQLSDHLLRIGGHVGYGVVPAHRRKGYAREMLRQALPIMKRLGIERALVTCDDDNVGSYKSIEANGGVLETRTVVPEHGPQTVRRYWIDLGHAAWNQRGYDVWSAFYDSYPNSTVAADEAGFPAFWAHVRGERVLEIGCGTGRHTVKLAAQGNDVTALDLSPGMLAVARTKPGLENVRFLETDLFAFVPEKPFEVIVAALVFEHVADLQALFVRVATLLAPGGTLFFSEIHPARGKLAHFKRPEDEVVVHLASEPHTEAAYERAIEAAGLRLVSRRDVGGQMTQVWTVERRTS